MTSPGPDRLLATRADLAGKADVSHSHSWSQISGKPSSFAPSAHSHAVADVTGLNTALSGKADLVGGVVPTSQIPAVALSKPFPVADRAAMLALSVQEGDVAVITAGADKGTYMLGTGAANVFASWVKLTTPDAPVQSVNGQTGTVTLGAADVSARASSWTPAWGDVSGKPATFPPAAHSHTAADVGAVARAGTAVTLWSGTQAQFDALPTATRNAAGFIAVIA